jgi:hypothetical protein
MGLSAGTGIPHGTLLGWCRNSYAIRFSFNTVCYLSGEDHRFQLPEGATRPQKKKHENVYGCGLVLHPENYLAIFFTLNGQLMGEFCVLSERGN